MEEINLDSQQMKEITSRFSFHKPDEKGVHDMRTIRRYVRQLAYQIQSLCPKKKKRKQRKGYSLD